MATREDLERKIDKLEVNMDRTDRIVNGEMTEDVMVDDGELVPSVRKWQKEMEEIYAVPPQELIDAVEQSTGAADRSIAAASRAETAADSVEQNADQIAADAAQQAASAVIAGVDGSVAAAQGAADRAETASDAAFVNADVYPDVAEGRAAVANGEQFQVLSPDGFEYIRYRRDSASSSPEVGRIFAKIPHLFDEVHAELESGGITSTGEDQTSASTSLRSIGHVPVYIGESITLRPIPGITSHRVSVVRYDENKAYIGRNTYPVNPPERVVNITSNGYIRYIVPTHVGGTPNADQIRAAEDAIYLNRFSTAKDTVEVSKLFKSLTIDLSPEIGEIYMQGPASSYTAVGMIKSTTDASISDDFRATRRTGKYLKVVGGTGIALTDSPGTIILHEYDSDFNYLGFRQILENTSVALRTNSKMIKISWEGLTVPVIKPQLRYMSLAGKPEWVYNNAQSNRPWGDMSFIYEAHPNSGRQILETDSSESQYDPEVYFNTGLLKLPYNYDPQGEPVRLIIFVQGSSGYLRFGEGTIQHSYESDDRGSGIFNYMRDEGYAILGVYPWTSKYAVDLSINLGTPTAMAAYAQAYAWVIKNFNVRDDGVFVSGVSSGGYCGSLLGFDMGMPVKATGLLAPVLSPFDNAFGPFYSDRIAYAQDFGFEGDHSVLGTEDGPVVVPKTEALRRYYMLNAPKTIGYNPMWNGLLGTDLTELINAGYEGRNAEAALTQGLMRVRRTPIKIWAAEDDPVNVLGISQAYVQSIRNAQGNAELRVMPNGTGGHGATDVSPQALRVPSITTKIGVVHTDVPLAIAELIQYFRRYE